jgi:hypothetical protein
MTRLWPLLFVLLAGCDLADADELLFGAPTGSGVVSIPFDATQDPGCIEWDGSALISTEQDCGTGSGGGSYPTPTVVVTATATPVACETAAGGLLGGAYQLHPELCKAIPATPTPQPSPTLQPTQSPWTCGTNGVYGVGGSPSCFVIPTPDGAGAGAPAAGDYIDVSGSTVSVDFSEVGDISPFGNCTENPMLWEFCTLDGTAEMAFDGNTITFANTNLVTSGSGSITATDTVCTNCLTGTEIDESTLVGVGAPTAGTYIDVSGQAVSVDLTEIADATIGDNSEASLDLTVNTNGSNDPQLQFSDGQVAVASGGNPALILDDTDIANGLTSDARLAVACVTGAECTASLSHRAGSNAETLIQGAGDGSGITIGTAGISADVTLATDSTGNGEVVLPDESIGGAEILNDGVTTADIADNTLLFADVSYLDRNQDNPAMLASEQWFGSEGFMFEGDDAADSDEGMLLVPALSADREWTLPDASGTVAVSATSPVVLSAAGAISVGDADDDGTTKGIAAFANDRFDCTAGVCDLAEDYMVVGDTIQPSQLNRLAANNQKVYLGTTDQSFFKPDTTVSALQIGGSFKVIVGPTPTAPAATPTLTAAPTATPTDIPTATAATATATATTLGTTATPTPSITPTPVMEANGGLAVNGKFFYPDDGSMGFALNTYGTSLSAAGWTGGTFIGVGASGASYSSNEFQAVTRAVAPMKCDRMAVCLGPTPNIANEIVRFTLRTGAISTSLSDTLLSCAVDGNSPNITTTESDGCYGGTWGTSGRKGCSIKLASPVLIPDRWVHTFGARCSGSACPSTALNGTVTLWCWPDNR